MPFGGQQTQAPEQILGVIGDIAIGLPFLLIKERRTTGYIEVGVQGPGLYHVTQIPVGAPGQFGAVQAQVNWARGLAAIARR